MSDLPLKETSQKAAGFGVGAGDEGGLVNGIDMTAHIGMRGVASIYIVIFHSILYSPLGLDWQGSSLMPLFFILSGFSLAVTYGAKPWLPVTIFPQCGPIRSIVDTDKTKAVEEGADAIKTVAQPFNNMRFWQNRVARCMPVYYLCALVALPLWFVNYGPMNLNILEPKVALFSGILTVAPFITLFSPLAGTLGFPIDPPGWTVCTLMVLWLLFPRWIGYAQRLTDTQLVRHIIWCYYIQVRSSLETRILQYGADALVAVWLVTARAHPGPLLLPGAIPRLLAGIRNRDHEPFQPLACLPDGCVCGHPEFAPSHRAPSLAQHMVRSSSLLHALLPTPGCRGMGRRGNMAERLHPLPFSLDCGRGICPLSGHRWWHSQCRRLAAGLGGDDAADDPHGDYTGLGPLLGFQGPTDALCALAWEDQHGCVPDPLACHLLPVSKPTHSRLNRGHRCVK